MVLGHPTDAQAAQQALFEAMTFTREGHYV